MASNPADHCARTDLCAHGRALTIARSRLCSLDRALMTVRFILGARHRIAWVLRHDHPISQRFRVHRQHCPRRPTLRHGLRAREGHPCLLRSHSTPSSSRPPTYGLAALTESREVTACRITATESAVDRLLLRNAGYVSVAELVRISPPKSATCTSGTTLSDWWATAGGNQVSDVRAVQAAPISNCVQREAS